MSEGIILAGLSKKLKIGLLSGIILGFGILGGMNCYAAAEFDLYDQAWNNINQKYVDKSNNEQNWLRWKNRYA